MSCLPRSHSLGLVFGALSLLYDAAHQSYLPRLIPASLLTPANARLEHTSAVRQTAGPMFAGGLLNRRGRAAGNPGGRDLLLGLLAGPQGAVTVAALVAW